VVNACGLLLALGASAAGCGSDGDNDASEPSPAPAARSSPTPEPTEYESPLARVPTGAWAGEHAILTVTAEGATAEFACAAGVIPRPVSLDAGGHFDMPGSYTAHPGGPGSPTDLTEAPWPASYRGRLTDAAHLTLTVVLPRPGETLGPFHLELGGEPSLQRCG
jgi:hypothetical protein